MTKRTTTFLKTYKKQIIGTIIIVTVGFIVTLILNFGKKEIESKIKASEKREADITRTIIDMKYLKRKHPKLFKR